ncbi:MAG: hypothetical protein Q9N26_00440 [Aquificota bacterium]|nr:hypothetical protein [Aquificota bacterium]
MGLMDRDYYREKKEESWLREKIRWVRENPLKALIVILALVALMLYVL